MDRALELKAVQRAREAKQVRLVSTHWGPQFTRYKYYSDGTEKACDWAYAGYQPTIRDLIPHHPIFAPADQNP